MRLSILGIYKINCIASGKFYIGSSANIKQRFANHAKKLKNNVHPNKHLQNAYNLYGKDSFVFEILEDLTSVCIGQNESEIKNILVSKEQHYLDTLLHASEQNGTFHKIGYNSRRKAESNYGIKYDESTKKRMGRRPGFKKTPEQIEANRLALTGRKMPPMLDVNKLKISNTRKRLIKEGKIVTHTNSQEVLDKLSKKYSKKVLQFDLQGNKIAEFDSKISCQRILNISGVSQCCTGKYRIAHGCVFLYEVDFVKMTQEDFTNRINRANTSRFL